MRGRDDFNLNKRVRAILSRPPNTEAGLRKRMLGPITRGLHWKAKLRVCRRHQHRLTQWEQNFVYDLDHDWHRRELLEVKQAKKLNEIYDKLVFDYGVDYRSC